MNELQIGGKIEELKFIIYQHQLSEHERQVNGQLQSYSRWVFDRVMLLFLWVGLDSSCLIASIHFYQGDIFLSEAEVLDLSHMHSELFYS